MMMSAAGVRSRVLAASVRLQRLAKAPAGGKAAKKKADGADSAARASSVPSELLSEVVVGANILKAGSDPKVKADEEYPEWLWTLLDKKPALSELRKKHIEDMQMPELERLVKLDNREKIKSSNASKAKS